MAQKRPKPLELELLCQKLECDYAKIVGIGNDEIAKKTQFSI